MNKYHPESMRSAVRALEEVAYQADTAKRINEQFRNEISEALRQLVSQAAHVQIGLNPIVFDSPAIRMQTSINNSIAEQLRKTIVEMQSPVLKAIKDISIKSDILSQFDQRGIMYTASTVHVDSSVADEDKEVIKDYSKSVIKASYTLSTFDFIGVLTWTYTACQFISDPTIMNLFFNILNIIHSNRELFEKRKDEL